MLRKNQSARYDQTLENDSHTKNLNSSACYPWAIQDQNLTSSLIALSLAAYKLYEVHFLRLNYSLDYKLTKKLLDCPLFQCSCGYLRSLVWTL